MDIQFIFQGKNGFSSCVALAQTEHGSNACSLPLNQVHSLSKLPSPPPLFPLSQPGIFPVLPQQRFSMFKPVLLTLEARTRVGRILSFTFPSKYIKVEKDKTEKN